MSEISSKNTEFGYSPSLALFERPPVNTGVVNYKWVQYRPISQISDSGLLQFTIPGTSNHYISLKDSYLQIKGFIVNSSGQPIQNDDVTFENLALQTLWNQVDLSLQQQIITSKVNTNYTYKAYLDVLLNSPLSVMENQLTSQLFYKDLAGYMEGRNSNLGYRRRRKITNGGIEIQLQGPLYLDLAQQERPIINGVEINLRFWPNKAPFYLSTGEIEQGYNFKITDATLNACMVEVAPGVLVGHAAALKESPALYPFPQSEFKVFSIAKGQYEESVDNIFQGAIPSDVVVGIVSSKSYIGSYEKNPFNFQNFDLSYCGFFVNGDSAPTQPLQPIYINGETVENKTRRRRDVGQNTAKQPSLAEGESGSEGVESGEEEEGEQSGENRKPTDRLGINISSETQPDIIPAREGETQPDLIPVRGGDFTKGNSYMDAYLSLFGQNYTNTRDIPISIAEYPKGFCLYKFQISETQNNNQNGFVSLPRRGHTRLTLRFRKPLPESVTVIVYAHFPRILQIDEARNITI
jgi:hypothetical protein